MKQPIRRIHFVGVGGVGTGSLATALAQAGYQVSGSDGTLYEPMRSVLLKSKIELVEGYHAETAQKVPADVVIIGNVVRKDNAEAVAWLQKGIPYWSFPQAVRHLVIENKVSVVCSGTHGKTTTTSWIAYLLDKLGMNPSYLIGGVPRDLPAGCVLTKGQVFVGEGDEYDSAFFDKGPKFLHYNPHYLIISSIEFDHADIYKDLAHVQSSFEKLIALVPGDGLCLARHEDPVISEVVQDCMAPVESFGIDKAATWRVDSIKEDTQGFHFEVFHKSKSCGIFETSMFGEHNLMNLLSGIAVASHLGHRMDAIRPWVKGFQGARRRQEILMTRPVTFIDDFAHHPTEVRATLTAVRRRFPKGKLWAFFEPRSATARRAVHQEEYPRAFDSADYILLSSPYRSQELSQEQRFSSEELAKNLNTKDKQAFVFTAVDEMVEKFRQEFKPGDVVVTMSNGEFGKIQEKLKKAIEQKS